jgi:hypothetical protein
MIIPPSFPEVIDSSMLSSFTNCPQLFHQQYINHWKLQGGSIHLHAGAAYAKGLEAARKSYLAGDLPAIAEGKGLGALIEAYGDYEAGTEAKSLPRMCGAIEFYFSQYPLQSDACRIATIGTIPAIEWSFAIPLPIRHPDTGNPLIFCGRTDCIVEMSGGLYALDDKTTSQLGASWSRQWELRGQFIGYAWAMRTLGLKPAGTIVRGCSILKTRYDTLQAIISQPDWKIDRWYSQLEGKLTEMIASYKSGNYRYVLDEACNHYGGCSMKQVCLANDPEPWLRTYYEQVEWKPLERH